MAMTSLTRRALMKSLGTFGMAMPFAHILKASVAEAADTPPLRLILISSPHGATPDLWDPQGGETDFNITYPNATLAPLEPWRSKLFIPLGLDLPVCYLGDGPFAAHAGHQGGPAALFTGTIPTTKSSEQWPSGPSIDEALAPQYGVGTRFPTLHLGVTAAAGYSAFDSFFFGAGGSRLPGMDNPKDVYDKVFKNLMVGGSTTGQADANKRLVLGTLKSDLNRLSSRLVGPEKRKLDAHLTAIDTIEKGLMATFSVGCVKPAAPVISNPTAVAQVPAVAKLQMDLTAEILACDLSRFVSIQFMSAGSAAPMPWVGLNMNTHDDLAHRVNDGGAAGTQARVNLAKSNNWFASQIAYLMGKLDAIHEGAGTVLDNTIIMWANELGNPATHANIDQPFLIAGGCGGKFRMGRCLRFAQGQRQVAGDVSKMTPHNGLLVGIARAFGSTVNSFGAPVYTGVLPGLMA